MRVSCMCACVYVRAYTYTADERVAGYNPIFGSRAISPDLLCIHVLYTYTPTCIRM